MRARRRQRFFRIQEPTVTDDSYGQPIRSYTNGRQISGFFKTGSGTKGELAEAIQGTQSNTFETRYMRDFTWTLEHRLQDIETDVVYRIVGIEDVDLRHDTFRIDLEELVT